MLYEVITYFAADTILEFKWWVDVIIALFFGGIVNQLILRDNRITSYNVCYTKLLRPR